jgi:hypothetical protein
MFIYLLKGIDHVHFVAWENIQLRKFQDSYDWLCLKAMELSTGLALQMKAQKEIVEFGKDMYMLDVKSLCNTWNSPELQVVAFEDDWEEVKDDHHQNEGLDDDDDGYDDDDSNTDDIDGDGDGDGDGDTFSKDLEQKVAHCQQDLSQFSPEVCLAVISPLSECIANRIASDKSNTEVFYPLTTRSVERMFSYWKRMMNNNADTKVSTMQAILLLADFDLQSLEHILHESPLTLSITLFLKGMSQTTKKMLDERIYEKRLAKTVEEKQKHQLTSALKAIHTKHSISEVAKGCQLWTMKHSVEFFNAIRYDLTKDQKKMNAVQLQDLVLRCAGFPKLTSVPSDSLCVITMDKQKRGAEVKKGNVHTIVEVLDHKIKTQKGKKNLFQYQVRWSGFDELDWVGEKDFVGFGLCEYWKGKVDEIEGIKEGKVKRITFEDEEQEEEEEEESYIISSILDHERIGGVIFYKVVWKGGEETWEPEGQFDRGELLGNFWKKYYSDINKDDH